MLVDLFYAGIKKAAGDSKFKGIKGLHRTGNAEEKLDLEHKEG